ncbi:carbohydrate ABC transporter permease [Paenibacillus sp. MZ04-78.2]|uniref:carbohydrate ABC transporter permease n=1 Tax=Paenibacillus sp. MZ04-78.2 TaxID=2962034 RepID=UPI0020B7108C|nr:carbohydrate ABC transporter permease [Paenibacillus sp. MZ04-78.2]MCP3776593.1 carbohydrate ABC transporter permease [Paenibacillus sp. MZ04-78.2]
MKSGFGVLVAMRHLVLLAFSFVIAFPFLWMLTSALKTNEEIWKFPPVLWPDNPMWGNFVEAWNAAPFGHYLFNSVFVASAIVLIQIVNSSMMAYALTHMKFIFRNSLMAVILITYMLPAAATYLPGYIILSELQLLDTYAGLIVSNSVSVFAIFLIRQAFMQLPKELVEAAKIDGASHWRILWGILIPLSKSTFVVMSILSFISQYNNYFWPMLITKNPDLSLISVGLRSFFIEGGAYGLKWPLIMASSSFAILPLIVLFICAQKWIMGGVNNAFGVNKG